MKFAIHLYYHKTRFKGSTLLIRDQGSLRKIGRVVIFLYKETLVPKKHPHLYSFPPFFVNLIIEFTGTHKLFIINSFPGFENIKFTFYFITSNLSLPRGFKVLTAESIKYLRKWDALIIYLNLICAILVQLLCNLCNSYAIS